MSCSGIAYNLPRLSGWLLYLCLQTLNKRIIEKREKTVTSEYSFIASVIGSILYLGFDTLDQSDCIFDLTGHLCVTSGSNQFFCD